MAQGLGASFDHTLFGLQAFVYTGAKRYPMLRLPTILWA
jgi:hypothetical protein